MQPSVAVRRFVRNVTAPTVSAPVLFVVIASVIVDNDRLEVVLRGEHAGTLAGAKRHAVTLLIVTAQRFGAACVDVTDGAGVPVFFASTTGGAA